ncbi:response regulator [Methanosarcinales archaeon]|nr:MAG: response regulator [Methanosarcinales archaeon]
MLLAVKIAFELKGIPILTVSNGEECIEALEKGFRGVILMDIMMPEMDGWDTIRAMIDKELFEGNLIAMLTAREDPGKKIEGLQEYVIDYLTKPFDPDELVNTVQEYIEVI